MKKILKYVIVVILIGIIYYFLSISIHNSGQFVNYYFYPSSSIKESENRGIFDKKISDIQIVGDNDAKNKIAELEFWLDKSITKKNFGMSGFLSYDVVDDSSRTLRISYKDTKKLHTTSYDDIIWFKLENGRFENPTTITGRFYKLGSKATIHFYNRDKQHEIGTVILKIK